MLEHIAALNLSQQDWALIGLCLLALFSVGWLFGWLFTSRAAEREIRTLDMTNAVLSERIKQEEQLTVEREAAFEHAGQRLTGVFSELADRSLATKSESFLKLARENLGAHQVRASADLVAQKTAINQMLAPVAEALARTQKQIAEIEKERNVAFGSIQQELREVHEAQRALRTETHHLVTALKRPEVRGQWGEITLKRLAELAGMVEHCDFVEQWHQRTEEGAIRPDMIVRLPESREMVVDAKTPLDAYLEAVEAVDDAAKRTALKRHAQLMRKHIDELSARRYWAQFEHSPEFVIMFVPGDQILSAAMAERPALLDEAISRKVILATPTSLVALLKAVSYGWRQLALAENARQIRDLAEALHKRLGAFTTHLSGVGAQLGKSVAAYNKAVGSLERSVLPGARKFTELGVEGTGEIDPMNPLEQTPRDIHLAASDMPSAEDDKKPLRDTSKPSAPREPDLLDDLNPPDGSEL